MNMSSATYKKIIKASAPDVQPCMDVARCRPLHGRAPLLHQLTNQRRVLWSRDEISANHSSPAGWRPWRPAAAPRARTRPLQPRNEAGTSETGALSSTGKHQKITRSKLQSWLTLDSPLSMSILTVCVVVRAASRLLVSASEVVEDDSTSEDCSSVVAEDMVMPNVTVLWSSLSPYLQSWATLAAAAITDHGAVTDVRDPDAQLYSLLLYCSTLSRLSTDCKHNRRHESKTKCILQQHVSRVTSHYEIWGDSWCFSRSLSI